MAFVFQDNSAMVFRQLDQNAQASMADLKKLMPEAVQEKILYGDQTPHGPDGHTEIVDTGRLFDSIKAETQRVSQNTYELRVGTNAPYAKYVHDGTYKLESRPFISDALTDSQETIKEVFTTNLPAGFGK